MPEELDSRVHSHTEAVSCPRCDERFLVKFVEGEPAPKSEEDAWRESVYSGLVCFASGALLGIAIGIIQD